MNPNRLLRKLGDEIGRLPTSPGFPPPGEPEHQTFEAILAEFAANCPSDSACADARALRRYLSNRRSAFFNDLLVVCRRHGVAFDGRRVADPGRRSGYLLRIFYLAAPGTQLAGFDTYAETLEHLEQPAKALRSLFACAAPGGELVIAVPDGRKDQQASSERRAGGISTSGVERAGACSLNVSWATPQRSSAANA